MVSEIFRWLLEIDELLSFEMKGETRCIFTWVSYDRPTSLDRCWLHKQIPMKCRKEIELGQNEKSKYFRMQASLVQLLEVGWANSAGSDSTTGEGRHCVTHKMGLLLLSVLHFHSRLHCAQIQAPSVLASSTPQYSCFALLRSETLLWISNSLKFYFCAIKYRAADELGGFSTVNKSLLR